MELEKGKTADRKGTVKAVWQKTGMALKKKKNKDWLNVHYARYARCPSKRRQHKVKVYYVKGNLVK
jgi:hypothetical protein